MVTFTVHVYGDLVQYSAKVHCISVCVCKRAMFTLYSILVLVSLPTGVSANRV